MSKKLEALSVICSILQILSLGIVLLFLFDRTLVTTLHYLWTLIAIGGFAAIVKFFILDTSTEEKQRLHGMAAIAGFFMICFCFASL